MVCSMFGICAAVHDTDAWNAHNGFSQIYKLEKVCLGKYFLSSHACDAFCHGACNMYAPHVVFKGC